MKKSVKSLVLLTIIVLVVNFTLSSQNKNDSLLAVTNNNSVSDTNKVKAFNKLGLNMLSDLRYKDAEYYFKKSLEINESISNIRGIAKSNALLGFLYMNMNDNSSTLKYSFKSNEMYSEIKDTTCQNYINNLNDIATVYMNVGLYNKSLEYYFRALRIVESVDNKYLIIIFNSNIASLYRNKKEYDKAIKYYTVALNKTKNNDTLEMYPNIYLGFGDIYYAEKDFNKSLEYYTKFLSLSTFIGDSSYICSANSGIGNVYKSKKQYSDAIEYLNRSLLFADDERNSNSYLGLGEIYMAKKQYNLAQVNFNKSLNLSKKIQFKSIICLNYKNIYQLDSCKHNYLGSMENHKLYIAYRDSMYNLDNERKMVATELNYNFDKEKTSLKLESELKSNKQKSIITIIAFVLSLVVLIALFIYKIYLSKNKSNKLITYQKHLVEEKQKEIVDNITYAKRIQSSIIPTNEYITKYAKENFIMYNPKDIVSGDFYWATELNGKFYVATADCTGHGVSGSMMSMLNISALNEVVNHRKTANTGDILNEVRNEIINALNPKGNEGVNDGMDCVMCAFDFDKKTLQYSAANNSFYIVRNGELIVCKSDKMPIGLGIKNDSFTTNEIQLQDNDMVYTFTDGYADQFGGEKCKKFKYKQLEELLLSISTLSVTEQKNILNEIFNAWKGTTEQTDDVLIMGVRI